MDKVQEAVEFIKEYAPADSYPYFLGFSGGKDSIVVAELIKMAGVPYDMYHSLTGLDAPEVLKFIRREYPYCKFLKPTRSFWRDLSTNCPPSNRLRWCCNSLKKYPSWKLPHTERVMGIRKEESTTRRKLARINYFDKLGHTHFYPIFYWTDADIWWFIEKNGLAYPELYDWGFGRIGCIICPFHSGKGGGLHKQYRARWPQYFKMWEKAIAKLYHKRKSQGREMYYDTPQEFLVAWYENNSARWYSQKDK